MKNKTKLGLGVTLLTALGMGIAGCSPLEAKVAADEVVKEQARPIVTEEYVEPTAEATSAEEATPTEPTEEAVEMPDVFKQSDYGLGILTTDTMHLSQGDLRSFVGEEKELISSDDLCLHSPRASPDNKKIAYLFSERENVNSFCFGDSMEDDTGVGLMNFDGSEQINLIDIGEYPTFSDEDLVNFHPFRRNMVWSPDSTKLAYFIAGEYLSCVPHSTCSGKEGEFIKTRDIVLILDVENGEISKVYDEFGNKNRCRGIDLLWAPDGENILFTSPREFDEFILYKTNIDTGDREIIINKEINKNPDYFELMGWMTSSEKHDSLFYISHKGIRSNRELELSLGNSLSDIYQMDLETGEHSPLTMGFDVSSYILSPDEEYIAFSTADNQIYMYHVEDRFIEYIHYLTEQFYNLYLLGWSPDGKEISFDCEDNLDSGARGVYRLNVETGDLMQVIDESFETRYIQDIFWYERTSDSQ